MSPINQVAELERGAVDYITSIAGPDLARLRSHADIAVVTAPAGPGGSFCIDTLIFNLRRPRFAALNVRRAFAHGINRRQLLEEVRFGQGRVATSPIASALSWAYNPAVAVVPFDHARALKLLDAAGVPARHDGTRFEATLVFASGFARTAEVIRENMARLGVRLRLQSLEVNAANERIFVENDFDIALASYCNGPDPEVGVTRAYVSTNIKPIPFSNGAGYRSE